MYMPSAPSWSFYSYFIAQQGIAPAKSRDRYIMCHSISITCQNTSKLGTLVDGRIKALSRHYAGHCGSVTVQQQARGSPSLDNSPR